MSHNQAVGATQDEPQLEALKPGAKLLRGQYEIIRFLSNGGFGITYLARDSLERDVVIKECYPGALCQRNGDEVEAANPDQQEDLRAIIDLFILEARNHARLVHPNIVDVHQVFEDNSTAYIAMDLIRGCDLLDYMENPENKAGPDFIVQVTEKMLSAVSFIHQSGMLHRDISPDNILIDENGEPILIDFGAARDQAANQSAALLTLRVIKDGYSPHEFYVRGAEQGPSSDLYVLAATLYHAISGERPIDGQTRLNAFNSGSADPYTPLAGRYAGYPPSFLEAIDKAMEVHTPDRLQTALDWLRMFRGPDVMFENFAYRPLSVIVGMDRKDKAAEEERIKAESENAEAVVTALLAGNADLALGNEDKPDEKLAKFDSKNEDSAAAVDTVVQSASGGNSKMILLAGVAVVALVAGGFFIMSGDSSEPEASSVTAEAPTTTEPETAAPEPVEQTAEAVTEPEEAASASAAETTASAQEDTPTAETAAVETTESTSPATAPTGPVKVAGDQIAYAHWDVDLPFTTSRRRATTGHVFAINSVKSDQDMSIIGEWVKRGATIFTLNGEPIRANGSLASQVLDNITVDPDGYARVSVRYRELGQTRAQNGLLAMPALRVFGMKNGYTFEARHAGENGWQTVVTAVPAEAAGTLQKGDILLTESASGTTLDAPESLDAALTALASEETPEAKLSVLRNGAETSAILPLAQE